MSRLLAASLTLAMALPVIASDFEGRVVRVLDGDTVEVLNEKTPVRVRLNGIDCPEKTQSYGQKAKQATSDLCFGKTISVHDLGKDRYGRTIGELSLNGLDLNHELVRQGLAWWYRKYAPTDTVLEKLENEAKQEKRGLWADANPVSPWDFRHGAKNHRADSSQ